MKKFSIILILVMLFTNLLVARSWWKDAVFYEVFVRSFYDANNDGIGDLKGLTHKLDYLNDGDSSTSTDLGVDALWLMPIFKSGSYHGYDTEDYYQINPDYGSMKDFDKLISQAHKRGMKIILDLVINHSSYKHEWFKRSTKGEAPYNDYYTWNSRLPSENWGRAWGGGSVEDVWNYHGVRKEWYYSAFNYRMPDLNLQNKQLRQEIYAITKFWLDKGVDGFRLDAARYLIEEGPGSKQADTKATLKWWKDFRKYVKNIKPEAVLIGEVWTSNDKVALYYNGGTALDLCFNFDLAEKIPAAVRYGNAKNFIKNIRNMVSLKAPLDFYSPFLSNHDTIRSMNILNNNITNAKLASLILLTLPGTPFIYYGEEIGLIQENGRNDKYKRTPMLWNYKKNAGFSRAKNLWYPQYTFTKKQTVSYQLHHHDSLLNHYKKLLLIRKQNSVLRNNLIRIIKVDNDKVLCYERVSDTQRIVVLINGSKKEQEVDLSILSKNEWIDLISGQKIAFKEGKYLMRPKQHYLIEEQ